MELTKKALAVLLGVSILVSPAIALAKNPGDPDEGNKGHNESETVQPSNNSTTTINNRITNNKTTINNFRTTVRGRTRVRTRTIVVPRTTVARTRVSTRVRSGRLVTRSGAARTTMPFTGGGDIAFLLAGAMGAGGLVIRRYRSRK